MANCYDVASCFAGKPAKQLTITYRLSVEEEAKGTEWCSCFTRSRKEEMEAAEKGTHNHDLVPWRVTPTLLLRDFECICIWAEKKNHFIIDGAILKHKLKD